ncbi:MAG: T4 RnlA family RNA ligase [bacterium]
MNADQYLKLHDLWDLERLKQHAQHNSVYVIQSPKFPDVVMLHYMDSCQYDNTWSTFTRMCRGLILDLKNRKVLAYPFEKFFNLGQTGDTHYDVLETLGQFETTEKLDGSMIIAFIDPNTDKLTFTTKGSLDSEHGQYANALQLGERELKSLRAYAEHGTLMFELIARQFQIVVDYRKKGYVEGLYLIGYRHNVSRLLAPTKELEIISADTRTPMFKQYQFDSLDKLIEHAKDLLVLDEGYVLRFKNDLLVKIKGTAYLAAHRFISHLSDRNILEAVSDGTASQLAQLAPEEYKQDVLDKIDNFNKRVAEIEATCYNLYSAAPKEGSRKDFALWVLANTPSHFKGYMFQLFENKPVNRKMLFKTLEEIDNIDGRTRL